MEPDISTKNCILTADGVQRKIRRMSFQIAENNSDEASLIIAGIAGNGVVLAVHLAEQLKQITSATIEVVTISLNKRKPLDAQVDSNLDFNNKVIIVTDDVANTGKTLLFALKPFLDYQPRKIQSLVLVERSHKLFPVQPDYVGLTIGTTLQEHITVETKDNIITGAWLH
ncbi:MAG: phosphoribosyltransferase family protein [Chitinophagaceae bacterium]